MGQNERMDIKNDITRTDNGRPDLVYIIQPEEFYNWKVFMYKTLMNYVKDNYNFFQNHSELDQDKFRIFSYVTKNIKDKIRNEDYFNNIEYTDRYIKLYNNTITMDEIKKEPNFQLFEEDFDEDISIMYINDSNKVYKTLPEMIKFINGGNLNNAVYIYYDYTRYFKIKQFERWIDVRFSKKFISDLFVFEQFIWRNRHRSYKEMENLLNHIFINDKLNYVSDIDYVLTSRDMVDFYLERYRYLGCNTQRSDDFE